MIVDLLESLGKSASNGKGGVGFSDALVGVLQDFE